MEGLQERSGRKRFAPGTKYPMHFQHSGIGEFQVLEHRLTVNRVHAAVGIGECVGVGYHVDIGKRSQVQVDQSRMHAHRSSTHREA